MTSFTLLHKKKHINLFLYFYPISKLTHQLPYLPQVGWLRTDTQTILSLHKKVVTHNTRISVTHSEPRTWNLHIRAVSCKCLRVGGKDSANGVKDSVILVKISKEGMR
ncbi:hypothetical protein E2C01_067935 [Portunus trituberculatus]|uniref:Uncharacterized protein n=1 Tax=Portunus trituberculatus TaxID=210409 RepID=A0A5B7HV13_PORTR|nr:hypothetical protein [Portunus trituberculatus]